MATFNKIESFVGELAFGTHDLRASGHTVKVYASNATPSASADDVKADLAEITAQNGYPSGGSDIQQDATEASGTITMTGVDVTWTGSGVFGPFRYIPMYNDTPTSPADPLMGWWDYGSSISPGAGESFTIDFGSSVLALT